MLVSAAAHITIMSLSPPHHHHHHTSDLTLICYCPRAVPSCCQAAPSAPPANLTLQSPPQLTPARPAQQALWPPSLAAGPAQCARPTPLPAKMPHPACAMQTTMSGRRARAGAGEGPAAGGWHRLWLHLRLLLTMISRHPPACSGEWAQLLLVAAQLLLLSAGARPRPCNFAWAGRQQRMHWCMLRCGPVSYAVVFTTCCNLL